MLLEKRLIEVLIAIMFLIFLVVAEKKTVAKAPILILPISFYTRFGQVNNFLILGISLFYFIFKAKDKGSIPVSITFHLFSIIVIYIFLFVLNFSNLDFSEGYLNSPHTEAFLAILSSIVLFRIVLSSIDSREDIRIFLFFVILAHFFSSIATVIQLILPSYMGYLSSFIPRQEIAETSWRGMRVYGTLGGYESYAEYTAMILVFLYVSWFLRILLVRLAKSEAGDYAIFVAFIKASLILFYVDQIKIEFVRTASSQHIIWGLFAITVAAVFTVPLTERIENQ